VFYAARTPASDEKANAMTVVRGRQFLHTPGPTNMPDRILRAMDRAALDHRGPEFTALAQECFAGLKWLFRTERPVLVLPSSGHGAWEAAFANTLSPGDRILVCETGAFSTWWRQMAERLGVEAEYLPGDWRHAVAAEAVEARLRQDGERNIRAVCLVHNETSTGVASDVAAVRRAVDAAGHPALFLVDTISGLGAMDFRMDEWGVDVAICGGQKGLMLPPGLGFTGISEKAWNACQSARLPRSYWDWRAMLPNGRTPEFTCTPPINLFFGLREALAMLREEGLEAVFARHRRLAGAARAAVRHWGREGGIELNALVPAEASDSVTAVLLPAGHDANAVRRIALERFNVSLAGGLMQLNGRAIRIGHLGDLNEPMLLGTLAATEMALKLAGVPHAPGGVQAAMENLAA